MAEEQRLQALYPNGWCPYWNLLTVRFTKPTYIHFMGKEGICHCESFI